MRSGCLESLPFCNYDRESPEPLYAAFGQLFLPVGHPTKPLAVRDWQPGFYKKTNKQNGWFLTACYLFQSLLLDLFLCIIQVGFLLVLEKSASQSQDVTTQLILCCSNMNRDYLFISHVKFKTKKLEDFSTIRGFVRILITGQIPHLTSSHTVYFHN